MAKYSKKYVIASVGWSALIILITLSPGKSIPDAEIFSYDKLGHATVFCVLVFLLEKGFNLKNKASITVGILVFTTTYGLMIEIVQEFIPDRAMEWMDAVANVSGSFLGLCVFLLSRKIK